MRVNTRGFDFLHVSVLGQAIKSNEVWINVVGERR
jgi:hypothetical protein